MTLAQLAARARRVRYHYAARETARTGRPWSRAELAQGFVGDVGQLMKLLMEKDGRRAAKVRDLDAALAHELSDCLWSVLVLADACDINLERAFCRTMAELEKKLQRPARLHARSSRKRPRSAAAVRRR